VLLTLDPNTGTTISRVPLPDVKVGMPVPGTVPYDPGVALAPGGRYFFVAYPDQPAVAVIDVFAPGLERIERLVSTDTPDSSGATHVAWLGISSDGRRLFVRRFGQQSRLTPPTPMQVIDVSTWNVSTADPLAASLQFSPDGRWIYATDSPMGPLQKVVPSPDPSQASSIGLRVLDSAWQDAARLLQGSSPMQVAQVSSTRLYVVQPGPDFNRMFEHSPILGEGAPDAFDLVAYEVGNWREVARRAWHLPIMVFGPAP
jgi:hypothetical protein